MTESAVHAALVWAVFALAAITFTSLLRLNAPYGRHYAGTGWGPEIPNRAGWIVMELPATLVYARKKSRKWSSLRYTCHLKIMLQSL